MRTLIEILAGLAILANAVIYGTDVFGAIVLRPAVASQLMWRVLAGSGGAGGEFSSEVARARVLYRRSLQMSDLGCE